MTAQTEQLSVLGPNPNANLNVVQFGIVGGNLQALHAAHNMRSFCDRQFNVAIISVLRALSVSTTIAGGAVSVQCFSSDASYQMYISHRLS